MSTTAEWIVVQLVPERIERAKRRAANQLARYPMDNGDFARYGGVPRELRLEWSQMAREAVAQHVGSWSLLREIRAQWTPRAPENARLKIPRSACDDGSEMNVRWVLVTGREPTFSLIGWARPSEAKSLGEWRTDALRPAYYIEPSRLHPVPVSAS